MRRWTLLKRFLGHWVKPNSLTNFVSELCTIFSCTCIFRNLPPHPHSSQPTKVSVTGTCSPRTWTLAGRSPASQSLPPSQYQRRHRQREEAVNPRSRGARNGKRCGGPGRLTRRRLSEQAVGGRRPPVGRPPKRWAGHQRQVGIRSRLGRFGVLFWKCILISGRIF
jgi:hypothetical protein